MRAILACAFVWTGVLLVAGCSKNVTNDPAFGSFKSVVGTWKTKCSLKLVEDDLKVMRLTADDSRTGWRVLVVVPEGTEIRVERLIYRNTFDCQFLDAMGSLVAGEYAGKPLRLDSGLFSPPDVTAEYPNWPKRSIGSNSLLKNVLGLLETTLSTPFLMNKCP